MTKSSSTQTLAPDRPPRRGRRSAPGLLLVVGLAALAAAVLAVTLAVTALSTTKNVSSAARAEVTGEATLLDEVVTTSPTGADPYEIRYLVLDRSLSEQRRHLEAEGWETFDTPDTTAGFDGSTERHNAIAFVQPLPDFLRAHRGSHTAELSRFHDLPAPDDLIAITLQPLR